MLAFRAGKLTGIVQMKVRGGLVYDLHAILDPVKLAFATAELETAS